MDVSLQRAQTRNPHRIGVSSIQKRHEPAASALPELTLDREIP
jgi:hypothetical protein